MSCSHCASKFLQPFVTGAGAGAIRTTIRHQRTEATAAIAPLLLSRRNYTSPTRPERSGTYSQPDVDTQRDDFYVPYDGVELLAKNRELRKNTTAWEERWTKAPINPMFNNSWNVESEATAKFQPFHARNPFKTAGAGAVPDHGRREQYEVLEKAEDDLEGVEMEEKGPVEGLLRDEEGMATKTGSVTYETFDQSVPRGVDTSRPYATRRNRLNEWELDSEPEVASPPPSQPAQPSKAAKAANENDKRTFHSKSKSDASDEPERVKPSWLAQKEALEKKLGGEEWRPRKRISPDVHELIRSLHKTYSECTTEKLAEVFKVSPEAIRRILKSKWQPTAEEYQSRMERWERRKQSIVKKYAEDGVFMQKEAKRQRQISKLENAYNKDDSLRLSQRML